LRELLLAAPVYFEFLLERERRVLTQWADSERIASIHPSIHPSIH